MTAKKKQPAPPPKSVAELLAASRQSHLNMKNALRTRSFELALAHLDAALSAREQADKADPEHTDVAWLADALHPKMPGETQPRFHRIPGKTPVEVARLKHDELMAFYRHSIDTAPVPLTEAEIRSRIIPPAGVAVEDTEAFKRAMVENGHTVP